MRGGSEVVGSNEVRWLDGREKKRMIEWMDEDESVDGWAG